MKKNNTEEFMCPGSIDDSLTDLLRSGAKRLIQEAGDENNFECARLPL